MNAQRAVVTTGSGPALFEPLGPEHLGEGEVTIDVAYSSMNYKDGIAVSGKGKIGSTFPLVCGSDLAGTVAHSTSPDWKPGDEVVVTGWGLSDSAHGGYTQRQRVPADWLVPRPQGLTLRQTMAVGTAGLTAMLAILAVEDAGMTPTVEGPVLVTGASGGVGSVAVAVFAHLGYRVTASTGRPEQADFLRTLGATDIIDRAELAVEGRPLDIERWAATVDSVGSTTLATAIRQTRYRGVVVACGLVGGRDLPITVLPFILRGVHLVGIHSVSCPAAVRARAWSRLASDLPVDLLDSLTTVEPLGRVLELAEEITDGRTRGRVVIDVNA